MDKIGQFVNAKLRNFKNQLQQAPLQTATNLLPGVAATRVGTQVGQTVAPRIQNAIQNIGNELLTGPQRRFQAIPQPQRQQIMTQAPKVSFGQEFNTAFNTAPRETIKNIAYPYVGVGAELLNKSKLNVPGFGEAPRITKQMEENRQLADGFNKVSPLKVDPAAAGVFLTALSFDTGIKGKPKKIEEAANYLRKTADTQSIKKIQDFVIDVQATGGKKNYGQLGQEIAAMARDLYGKKVETLSNTQLANLLDSTLQQIGRKKNDFNLGLSIDDVRGGKIAQTEVSDMPKRVQKGIDIASRSEDLTSFAQNWGSVDDQTRKEVEKYIKQNNLNGYPGFFEHAKSRLPQPSLKEQLQLPPERARMSSKAIEEGIEAPRKGSDVSVLPQAAKRFKAKPNPLPWETPEYQSINSSNIPGQPPRPPVKDLEEIVRKEPLDVRNKVNLLDYLRTPDRVLKKIGLGTEAEALKKSYGKYLEELPQEINRITDWSKRVAPDSNQRIFQHLDGQGVKLSGQEQQIANEIETYLKVWADKLGLPEDKRITNYITHIFEPDFIQKEFDPELAALIQNKVAGSVYDPFVQKRLGQQGYIEDTWRALDAYVKRAVRKYNMDPALKQVQKASQGLEESQFKYVKRYVDKINLRPGELDNLVDNTIKSLVGYRFTQRPTAYLTRAIRQATYRGALGLNVGSAIRNLTQGLNTYARLGEKYTVVGYAKLINSLIDGSDELNRVGVLRNDFIQDRSLNASKKFWENVDKGLFSLFELAERINRGSAYFGAKAQALSKGMNEEQAIEYAKNLVRDTQFTFGTVDTPVALQNDFVKTILQFQSYNVKQLEFLVEQARQGNVLGLARYGLGGLLIANSVGQLFGLKPTDLVPYFRDALSGQTRLGEPPIVGLLKEPFKTKDAYGNDLTTEERVGNVGKKLVPFIPGGVQLKKTYEGLSDTARGYKPTASGNVRFPVRQNTATRIRAGLFGTSNLPEAQQYYDNDVRPLSEKQSEQFRQSANKQDTYNQILEKREATRQEGAIKEQVKAQDGMRETAGKVFYMDNGEVKSVMKDRAIYKAKLTGNTELDKKELEKQSTSYTSKINDIVKLYELGQIKADEAEKQIRELQAEQKAVKAKYAAPKKLRIGKVKIGKVKIGKVKVGKPRLKKVKLKNIKPLNVKAPKRIRLIKKNS